MGGTSGGVYKSYTIYLSNPNWGETRSDETRVNTKHLLRIMAKALKEACKNENGEENPDAGK